MEYEIIRNRTRHGNKIGHTKQRTLNTCNVNSRKPIENSGIISLKGAYKCFIMYVSVQLHGIPHI